MVIAFVFAAAIAAFGTIELCCSCNPKNIPQGNAWKLNTALFILLHNQNEQGASSSPISL